MSPPAPAVETTVAGSLPKPSWLARPQVLWAPWQLAGEQLAEGKRDAVRSALKSSSPRLADSEMALSTLS